MGTTSAGHCLDPPAKRGMTEVFLRDEYEFRLGQTQSGPPPTVTHSCKKKRLFGDEDTRMAQRWPSASRPARDARMSRAPARGAPVVSAPQARRYTRVSPHAHNSLLPAHGAPRRQVRNPEGAEGGDGGGEALVDDRADRGRDVHRQNAPARPPCTNRTAPCRAVPCRAVPCRAVPCRAVPCPLPPNTLSLKPSHGLEPAN